MMHRTKQFECARSSSSGVIATAAVVLNMIAATKHTVPCMHTKADSIYCRRSLSTGKVDGIVLFDKS